MAKAKVFVGFVQRAAGLQNEVLELGRFRGDVDFGALDVGAIFLDRNEIRDAVTAPVREGEIKLRRQCLVHAASYLGRQCLEARGQRGRGLRCCFCSCRSS